MRVAHGLVGLVLLIAPLAACGGDDDDDATDTAAVVTADDTVTVTTGPSATTTAAATATTAPAAADSAASGALPNEVTIEITDFTFGPADVEIAAGGTITFVNNDTQQHTATAAGVFDTGAIAPGASATVTVDEPGTIDFICAFHPFMTGSVTVA